MKAPFAFLQHSKSTRSQVAIFLNWISNFSPIDTNRVFPEKRCDLQFWLKICLTATSEAIHLQLSAAAASRRRRSEKLFLFPENNENKLNRAEVGKMSFNGKWLFSEWKCSWKEKRSWGWGRNAQWILFSLRTQQPRVWFLVFPRSFLNYWCCWG